MYKFLSGLHQQPALFSAVTTKTLWTDPHIAQQMLHYHLNPGTDLASRQPEKIDAFCQWLNTHIGVMGKRVCDLGCGPGLYAERLAVLGADVVGVDFSPVSIAYARSRAAETGTSIIYQRKDYLSDELPKDQDIVLLIYLDFCALSPDQRQALLRQVHTSLKPGGLFVLDVLTEQAFEARQPDCVYAENLLDGFWSANDYFGFQHTFTYPDDFVTLDQYTIIEAERTWQVFNWLTHFRPDDLLAEFEGADFEIIEMNEGLAGSEPAHNHSHVVVARARA